MPHLNSDILFEIGEKLIEEGCQEDVSKFVVCGTEPHKEMKKIFASATALGLHFNYCILVWSKKRKRFIYNYSGFYYLKSLMACLGKSVKHLSLNYFVLSYQPCINNIISNKQLVSLDISGAFYNPYFLNNFLLEVAPFVKNLSVTNNSLNEIIRDNFDLDSLKITDRSNSRFMPFSFFCKTSSMLFSEGYSIRFFLSAIDDALKNSVVFSPYVFSTKKLTFDESVFFFCSSQAGNLLDRIMKYYPTLQLLKFICYSKDGMPMCRKFFTTVISEATNVPPKVIIFFQKEDQINNEEAIDFDECKKYCEGFDFDETISDAYCFRKTFPSAGAKSTILEYHFAK